ncbi:MAG: sulfotransferase domain-containing protein [Proteobacteria bacterium]|nr:sulfotransferase domain-containing protein [Pseudomonadota bacterium]
MLVQAPKQEVRSWTTDSRRWSHYKPRPGDVVIATPAKCGTTWMQQIVSLLIFQTPEPRSLQGLSPWIDHRFAPIEKVIDDIEAQTHRRFLKAHLGFDQLPIYDEVRYIHVARDGRDAFMSWHNHMSNYTAQSLATMDLMGEQDETIARPLPRAPADLREFFQTWMTQGEGARLADDMPAARFFEIERSWWKERTRPNLLLVHYNDLKADLASEMQRIAAFLDIAVDEETWPCLVEAASFEAMKRAGATLMPRAVMAWDKGADRFLNKGTNERWRDVLSAEDVARYEARVARELSPGLAGWLERGRIAAGDPHRAQD